MNKTAWHFFITETDYMINNNCIQRSCPAQTTPSAVNQGTFRIYIFIHLFLWQNPSAEYKIEWKWLSPENAPLCIVYFLFVNPSAHLFVLNYIGVFICCGFFNGICIYMPFSECVISDEVILNYPVYVCVWHTRSGKKQRKIQNLICRSNGIISVSIRRLLDVYCKTIVICILLFVFSVNLW